jgi:WD40 repeat protein
VKFSDIDDVDLQNALISVSYDKTLKLWDKRSSECIKSVTSPNNKEFYCVDNTSNQIIVGSNESVLIYDLRKMKVLHHFTELHSDECTSVKFNQFQPNFILTAGEDCVLNLLDLKDAELEDEYIEASYTSDQPLANCGFIGNTGLAYTITNINTIEIIDLETMLVIKSLTSFKYRINYVIQGQYINNKMLFFLGNNYGEVYIYEFDCTDFKFLDIVVTKPDDPNEDSEDSVVIRNAFCIDDKNIVVSADTGDLYHYRYHQTENKAKLEISDDIKFTTEDV